MHPQQVARTLGVKDLNGRPIFLTAIEAPSFGVVGSILGYPLTMAAVLPTTNDTNVPNDITNVGATTTATLGLAENESFAMEVFLGLTNACTGTLDIRWCTSLDGVNFCNALGTQGQGWFGVPLTNNGTA